MAKILVAVDGTGNRRLLQQWLTPRHDVVADGGAGQLSDTAIDLIIVDAAACDRLNRTIVDFVSRRPILVPVLLIISRARPGTLGAARHRPGVALPKSWTHATEMITVPITKTEFDVRIANLLRLRERERYLYEAKQLLRLATEVAKLGFWQWDTETDKVYFPLERRRHPRTGTALPDRLDEWMALVHPEDWERVSREITLVKSSPAVDFEIEYRLLQGDGRYLWIRSRVARMPEEIGTPTCVVVTQLDISEEKLVQERIRQVSQHDPLTGLLNRALLQEFAEHQLARARRTNTRLAFLYLDLDRFKPINDTFGHHVGDLVLKEVARRVVAAVRTDDLVARLGGDEFVAVLTQIRKPDDAARVASHALELLRQPYQVSGTEIHCSPSIGISLYPQDGNNIDVLIQRADDAMYHAKKVGRNGFQFFTEALNQQAQATALIEKLLHDGLERKTFRLFYQPVLDTDNADVVWVEALIRMPATAESDFGPAAFIPVAEASGLIHGLGNWVVREACRQHRQWLEVGLPPIPVAINISSTQLRTKDFPQGLASALHETSIDSGNLMIELAETGLATNMEESLRVLGEIRRLGIKVTLDDFGTGSLSLYQLGRIPIDKIKIDGSIIRSLVSDESSGAIVDSVIALGDALSLETVASGIETEEALQFVKRKNCRQAQGFYFCRPLPPEEFAHWYSNRQRAPVMRAS